MKRNLWHDFQDFIESLQSNGRALLILSIGLIVLMGIITVGVFFLSVKGSEEVMVPDVVGKEFTTACLEMEVKELYPRLQLRYSNSPEEKGRVLEQNPAPGAIVKAGRRIDVVVSRGVVIDRVENFVGQKLDDVKMHLQSLFTSSTKALIVLDEPMYSYNAAEAGTIIEQDPPADTDITSPIKLKLVVSKGPAHERTKVPTLVGLSLNDTLLQMSRSKLVFEFTSRPTEKGETPATVVSQLPADDTYVDTYTRVSAVMNFPEEADEDGMVYGIFTEELPEYAYALQIKLEALTPEGERYPIVTVMHPGGLLTIPYYVPQNTILILSIYDKEAMRKTVE